MYPAPTVEQYAAPSIFVYEPFAVHDVQTFVPPAEYFEGTHITQVFKSLEATDPGPQYAQTLEPTSLLTNPFE